MKSKLTVRRGIPRVIIELLPEEALELVNNYDELEYDDLIQLEHSLFNHIRKQVMHFKESYHER